ncbi:hypothetical protein HF086_009294 [Spodoptera exigua]|uniref:Uncharacterized protein n=1 Tax=Spodoptera exigua TaxID=7107 RepID=A0A922M2T8_SPOEX|nr:hypothetical protein HF086_009294 [Spodoptera exigua]
MGEEQTNIDFCYTSSSEIMEEDIGDENEQQVDKSLTEERSLNKRGNSEQRMPEKRGRQDDDEVVEDDEGFVTIVRGHKRAARRDSKEVLKETTEVEECVVCVTSNKERFPKQFGMAKWLRGSGIENITKMSFKGPYKILIHFENRENKQVNHNNIMQTSSQINITQEASNDNLNRFFITTDAIIHNEIPTSESCAEVDETGQDSHPCYNNSKKRNKLRKHNLDEQRYQSRLYSEVVNTSKEKNTKQDTNKCIPDFEMSFSNIVKRIKDICTSDSTLDIKISMMYSFLVKVCVQIVLKFLKNGDFCNKIMSLFING